MRSTTRLPSRIDYGVRRVDEPAAIPVVAPAPEEADRPAAGGGVPQRRGVPRPLAVLLAAVAALGVTGSAVFGVAWSNASALNSAERAAATSARSLVVALTNFDPGTVRADFRRIQSMSTGSFASQAKHFFASSIGRELSAAGAASRGRVDALDVQSVSGSHATAFAVVSQTYLNDKVKTPVADTLRLVVGLDDASGRWLVSSVEVVQQPTP